MKENENKKVKPEELEDEKLQISKEEGFSEAENELDSKISSEIINITDDSEFEKASEEYTADEIEVLEGLEPVRKRPGMYIGSTSSVGLHHLVWEILDNGIDEALAGFCDTIDVFINEDNSITVIDNGRGIPYEVHKKTGKSTIETVFTVLHAGGKFGNASSYKVSGGLHGVGASVVNALSTLFEVTVWKDGGEYHIKFVNGGNVEVPLTRVGDSTKHGTKIRFKPDPNIFTETTVFNRQTIEDRIRQLAYLNKGITIRLTDLRDDSETVSFKFDGGIVEYVNYLNQNQKLLQENPFHCEALQVYSDKEKGIEYNIIVEVAMQYTLNDKPKIYSFCNNVSTPNGGMHLDGFKIAVKRILNNYCRNKHMFKKDETENFKEEDITKGLTAVVSVKHPNPEYEGQTKGKLGNVEVKKIASNIVGASFERYLTENEDIAKLIAEKVMSSYRDRLDTERYNEMKKKNGLELTSLPGKLADCSSNNPEECELFIVEGNSAGGSAKSGRDPKIQAILPLRGKILNVKKASDLKISANAEIGSLIKAIGAGFDADFDITKIRYHKVIIMTDADVDGSHIRILLLTFFNRFMHPLLENGNVYIAQPPLYKVEYKGQAYYAYNDAQLEIIRKELNLKSGYPFQRYKGLGEMDASQLEETTMDPKARKLLRVTIEDAAQADLIFENLMGEEVTPRTDFLNKNAKYVKNLDI